MTIIQFPNPILTNPVSRALVNYQDAKSCYEYMVGLLKTRSDGVALAANQAGMDIDMFVYINELGDYIGVVNSVINELSKESTLHAEGCLSLVVNSAYQVNRYNEIRVNYIEYPSMELKKGWLSGRLAQIFQHEMDHLSGILISTKSKEPNNG